MNLAVGKGAVAADQAGVQVPGVTREFEHLAAGGRQPSGEKLLIAKTWRVRDPQHCLTPRQTIGRLTTGCAPAQSGQDRSLHPRARDSQEGGHWLHHSADEHPGCHIAEYAPQSIADRSEDVRVVVGVDVSWRFTNQVKESVILCPKFGLDLQGADLTENESLEQFPQPVETAIRCHQSRDFGRGEDRAVEGQARVPAEFERLTGCVPGIDRILGMWGCHKQHGRSHDPERCKVENSAGRFRADPEVVGSDKQRPLGRDVVAGHSVNPFDRIGPGRAALRAPCHWRA